MKTKNGKAGRKDGVRGVGKNCFAPPAPSTFVYIYIKSKESPYAPSKG